MERIRARAEAGVFLWETLLAIFLLVSVAVGSVDLVRYLRTIFILPPEQTYVVFQSLIGHVLLLVVGLELVVMLIRHTPGSIIEVLIYAIARKLLVPATGIVDFTIGVAAIAGLFAIRRFLFVARIDVDEHVVSAATPVKTVNEMAGTHIPAEIANTIGGIVAHLAGERLAQVKPHDVFHCADAKIEILSVNDGVLERVRVSHIIGEGRGKR